MDTSAGKSRKVELGPLEKNGDKVLASIDAGNMIAILSGMEVLYTFVYRDQYQCFIHPLDAEEGRHKGFAMDDHSRAMLKNLDSAADQIFEIKFASDMDFFGVMEAAEQGIVNFLDSIGQNPAGDFDFMAALDGTDTKKAEEQT